MATINILVVDDKKLIREGFISIFKGVKDIRVAGEAADGQAAIDFLEKKGKVDVVLMDYEMEGMNGIEATALIKEKYPEVKVLVLSNIAEQGVVRKMLRAGAIGYIDKNCDSEDLVKAVYETFRDEQFFSTSVIRTLADMHRNDDLPREDNKELTPMENLIVKMVVAEYSNKEIAEIRCVAPRTIDTHRNNILQKIGKSNPAGLVRWAIENEVVPTPEEEIEWKEKLRKHSGAGSY